MITVDLASSIPLHDQIVRFLRHSVATGGLTPGDQLPAVRQLAADLGINFNTVARAYRALENMGLVRTARGRGTQVVAAVAEDNAAATTAVREAIRNALADARLAGLSLKEVRGFINQEALALWPDNNQENTQP